MRNHLITGTRLAPAVFALALAGGLLGAASGPASAAPTPRPVAVHAPAAGAGANGHCDFQRGTTSNLKQSPQGPAPVGGTIWTKPGNTTCHDLNLSFVSATDRYEGWLQNSHTGRWGPCSRGFVRIRAGHQSTTHPPVLCTNVLARTHMAVVAASGVHRKVTVED